LQNDSVYGVLEEGFRLIGLRILRRFIRNSDVMSEKEALCQKINQSSFTVLLQAQTAQTQIPQITFYQL